MADRRVVVIGSGPGGMAAAMQLAAAGFRVDVFEKQPYIGGRTSLLQLGDYRFDRGPTFLNMPHILSDSFAAAGRRMEDVLPIAELVDPMYRLQFGDVALDATTRRDAMRERVERLFPGNGAGYDRFMVEERKKFEALAPLLRQKHDALTDYFRPTFLKALPRMNVTASLYDRLASYYTDERLRLAFTFQAKYLGMSPWECPGAFTILSYMEHAYGVHHPIGGLNRIPEAMRAVLETHGGAVHTGTGVKQVIVRDGRAVGVELDTGDRIAADEVVVNADFGFAASRLFAPGTLRKYAPERLRRKTFSCSTFMLYLGVNRTFETLPHHTVLFSDDYKKNVEEITRSMTLSGDPSVYIHNPSVTDDTLAPAGKSALYVLAPVPNNRSGIDWEREKGAFRELVLRQIRRAGFVGLEERIEVEACITPADWEDGMYVYEGATFNMGHRLSQMMYFRPHNRFEEVDGCWLVGGGTHPGSGLPTILESARITSRGVLAKYGAAGVGSPRASGGDVR
ncbi:phytoene desaturase family protein [Paenibacillus sp. TRM 82003]|nr:phytoene desaturase family protein [Paenibacillus sp. TRM 82003]